MSDEVPGLPEIYRAVTRMEKRLDDAALERRADEVERAKRLADMEARAAERERLYLRADVYAAQQQTDLVQSRAWEAELHSLGMRFTAAVEAITERLDKAELRAANMRNLLLGSFALPLLVLLIAAVVLGGQT